MKLGTVIAGKFRIERVIGRGAMGIVVESTDVTLGRRVAVKLILPQYAGDEQLRGRFIREAHVMTRLASEHVAKILEVGELEDGMLFMAMEYLEGQSLEEMISSGGPLPPADAVDLILEALDAVAEAHELGLVHRDIKPSNLFLAARKGKDPILKVLDFGIVKDSTSNAKLTATGTLPGTPAYMAPEQVALQEDLIDARADIWALGVTLYELLTGELPFGGPINVMLTRIRTEAAPRLRGRRPDVAPELEAIVDRCMSKHPQERFRNGAELSAALKDLRMRGLIRSERGAERNAVATEISINRGGPRRVRETAETAADPSVPGAPMPHLPAHASQSVRAQQQPPQKARFLPFTMFVIALAVVAIVVLALQGRLSPSSSNTQPPGSVSVSSAPSTIDPSPTVSTPVVVMNSASPSASGRRPTTLPPPPAPGTHRVVRLVSARNTGDRAWRAWLERHRNRMETCSLPQTCPVIFALRLQRQEGNKVTVTLKAAPTVEGACPVHSALIECMNDLAREPVPPPDSCADPADCHADVTLAFD